MLPYLQKYKRKKNIFRCSVIIKQNTNKKAFVKIHCSIIVFQFNVTFVEIKNETQAKQRNITLDSRDRH